MEKMMTLSQLFDAIDKAYEHEKQNFDDMVGVEDGFKYRIVLRNRELIVCSLDGRGRHPVHSEAIEIADNTGLMTNINNAIAMLKEDDALINAGFSLSFSARFDKVFYYGGKEVEYEPTDIYVDVDDVYTFTK